MNYKKYEVTCTFEQTNKRSTRKIHAQSQKHLKELMTHRGYVGPFDIKVIPFRQVSHQQLHDAEQLGISIPGQATVEDADALIKRNTDGDREPHPGLYSFAYERGLCFSQYIGERALYNLVWENLDLKAKIEFFTYSIYHSIHFESAEHLDISPYKDLFESFAEEAIKNDLFVKSINDYSGEDLTCFEMLYHEPDLSGSILYTYAYKKALTFLISNCLVEKEPRKRTEHIKLDNKNESQSNQWNNPIVTFFSKKVVIITYTVIMSLFTLLLGIYDGFVSFLIFGVVTFVLFKLLTKQRKELVKGNELDTES
ncbi:hypothetical protein [Radiobacillus sp. PE A8.2]|uniref:hypothetical protein n=1 Tax=Radiobacillus sp. PE A8.2 TaxID=3380349 RepID=UPI00388F8924